MAGRTRHALVSPQQDAAVLTFVQLACSNHDHEKSISPQQKFRGVFVGLRWSRESLAMHRPQEHTNDQRNFHASMQRSFPQDKHHFCATVDRSNGTVSDSRVGAHYHCSEKLVHRLGRQCHRLVAARHHQEEPDTHSLWGELFLCL